ncbi:MAG: hypothetical protein ABIU30_18495 [Ferruginibacter sp.]
MKLLSVLGLIFIVLKLTNLIAWSWWYITMPFWFGIAVYVFIIIVAAIIRAALKIR